MAAIFTGFLKYTFIGLLLLILIGVLYEQYTRWQLEKTAFRDKTFVEINGKPLHYVKKGTGDYTVVFMSGMGSSHAIWENVQHGMAPHAVTLSYDRNGLMFSEASGQEVTNRQVSEELRLLLEKTGCPKPYILVGHSMASIYMRPFVQQHRNDIAGIMLVEGAHPQQIKKSSPALRKAVTPPPNWLIALAVHTGLYRILFSIMPLSPEIPFGHKLHVQERDFFYRSYRKTLEELKNDASNFDDTDRYADFGNIPLTVVRGTSAIRYASIKDPRTVDEYRQLVDQLQHDLLTLSSNSLLIEAENSGHLVQIHDSDLLIEAVKKHL